MHLTPREQERLLLAAAADLARRRLARGAPLGATEAVALVCDEICELAWDGVELAAVIERARAVVPAAALLPGVASLVPVLEVEALFPWGTTLVHVDRPFPEDQNQQPPYLERTEETLAPSGSPDPAVDAGRGRHASGRGSRGRRRHHARARRCREGRSCCATPGAGTCGSRRTSRSTRSTPRSRSGSRTRRSQGPFEMTIGRPGLRARRRDGAPPAGCRLDLPAGEALRLRPGEERTAAAVITGGPAAT